jgi:hypothetical protein
VPPPPLHKEVISERMPLHSLEDTEGQGIEAIKTPWPLVRSERPPLVGEVSANFCG